MGNLLSRAKPYCTAHWSAITLKILKIIDLENNDKSIFNSDLLTWTEFNRMEVRLFAFLQYLCAAIYRICHTVIIQHATAYKHALLVYLKVNITFVLKNKVFEMWLSEDSHLEIPNMAVWKGSLEGQEMIYLCMELPMFYSCTQSLISMLTSKKWCGLFCALEEARGYRQTGLWTM